LSTSRSPVLAAPGTLTGFMSAPTIHEEAPWQAGVRSARANLVPGLVLQAFALAFVLGYYLHEPTRAAFTRLGGLRDDMGLWFGIVFTGLCGGLLPLLYLKAAPSTRALYTWKQGAALTLFWSYKGVEIGLWYALLARVIGPGGDFGTIAVKSLIDQFIYCPLWAIPTTALVYFWSASRFSLRAVIADLRAPRWYARRVLPILLANLGVWLPLVFIIYALPTPLQLPLQNIVLCFFTLMLAHMSQRRR
jgi:hypothetical protein